MGAGRMRKPILAMKGLRKQGVDAAHEHREAAIVPEPGAADCVSGFCQSAMGVRCMLHARIGGASVRRVSE